MITIHYDLTVPNDPRDARIAALEGDVSRLSEALNSIKLDRESSDVTWCPQCGPHVIVDDEGLCEMCGATSVGAGAARAVALAEENAGLKSRVAELETSLDEAVNAEGGLYDKIEDSLLTALGFPGTLDEAVAEAKRLRDIAQEVERVLGEDASPRDVRRALGEPPAPLRLGRGPTPGEVEIYGDLWLLRDGDDTEGTATWSEYRLFVEGDVVRVPARWGSTPMVNRIVTDAIPLSASRHPCGVGVTQGQAMADAFKDLAQRQTSLGAAASAAITAQDLWDMHDTGEKETP